MPASTRTRREFLRASAAALAGSFGAARHDALAAETRGKRRETRGQGSTATRKKSHSEHAEGLKLRGLLVDAGRVPESVEYYRRVIDFCTEWGLNALQFRLADDQGSALRFPFHPDLVTHRNALTPEEMKGLVEYGQSHDVDLIPELESFGHTGYITRSPKYRHLLDQNPQGPGSFTGVIPVDPETLDLFSGLYREVVSIFSSPYLHGGCDEVNWGGSALSRRALKTKSRPQIWADYLNALNRISEELGKRFIVWGDFVLHKEPAILPLLDKNIVIMDWNYWDNSSATLQDSLRQALENGSSAIGAPALMWSRWGPRAGAEQLRNIDAFAEAYLAANDPRCLGLILTNWVPCRYIQGSIWDGCAYGAVAFTQGSAVSQTSAFRRFVEKHYGAEWTDDWLQVFQMLYHATPCRKGEAPAAWMTAELPVPWSNDEELKELLKQAENFSGDPGYLTSAKIRSRLLLCEPTVRSHLDDFQAFALAVTYLEQAFWRNAVVERARQQPMSPDASATLIESIAERDRALSQALDLAWDHGRPANSEAKLEPLFDLGPGDQLAFQFRRAADYSAFLADHPNQFHQILSG